MITAAYQGIKGSYSEEAAIKYFGNNEKMDSKLTFEDVFLSIINGSAKYGVLPLENTTTGAVYQVYDLLGKYGLHIVGEVCLDISHCLLAIKGATIEGLTTIFSHEQGLWQCNNYLKMHKNWILEAHPNTAVSAKRVKDLSDKKYGAIASKRAMEAYGLECLAENIQDQSANITRFIIASKRNTGFDKDSNKDNNKVSITFTLSHKSGTLYNTLEIFERARLNLTKIESRPIIGSPWEYRFYIDFEGNTGNKDVIAALNECENVSASYRLLGCYKTAIAQQKPSFFFF